MQIIPLSVIAIIVVYLTIRALQTDEDQAYREMMVELDPTKLPEWAQKDPHVIARAFKDHNYRLEVLSAEHPQVIDRLKRDAKSSKSSINPNLFG